MMQGKQERKKKNRRTLIFATVVFALLILLPATLLRGSERLLYASPLDGENPLKSQIFMTGQAYRLNYDQEQEIKEKMENRAEILEKKHEEEKENTPPTDAKEILTQIEEARQEEGKEQGSENKGQAGTHTENPGPGTAGGEEDPKPNPDQPSGGDNPSAPEDDNYDDQSGIAVWEGDPSQPPPPNVDKDMITPWDPIINTDLVNRKTYAQCLANFKVTFKNFDGTYFRWPGKLHVFLNGVEVYGDVDQRDPGGEYGYGKARNYNLDLREGKNYISIIAKDDNGFYTEKRFIVYGKKDMEAEENDYVTIQFAFDLSNIGKGMPVPRQDFRVRKGTVISKAVVEIMQSLGYQVKYDGVTDAAGFYLWGIGKPGLTVGWSLTDSQIAWLQGLGVLYDEDVNPDSLDPDWLYHKQVAKWSGYMWYLNGAYVPYGLSQTEAKDGDDVYLWWTNHYGEDLPGTHD